MTRTRKLIGPQICEVCKIVFYRSCVQRFCSRSCVGKWNLSRPEMRAALYNENQRAAGRKNLMDAKQRPDVQAKLAEYQKSARNPILRPEIRAKASAIGGRSLRKNQGGNGKPLSAAHALLVERLGADWKTDYSARTETGYRPYRYLLDMAHPVLKINVEADGNSHRSKSRRESDIRRDKRLSELEWLVLRFTNKQVLEDADATIRVINAACDNRRLLQQMEPHVRAARRG